MGWHLGKACCLELHIVNMRYSEVGCGPQDVWIMLSLRSDARLGKGQAWAGWKTSHDDDAKSFKGV